MDLMEAKAAADELGKRRNPKQRAFAEYYLQTGSEVQSAIAAGYAKKSAASQGSKLRSNPAVADYIAARENQLFAEMGINEGWVGRRLAELHDRCAQAKPHMEWNPATRKYEPDGYWMFDAKGAHAALQSLGKMLGMFGKETEETAPPPFEEWLRQQEITGKGSGL